ncbi:MAG: SagB/ThcOx family dehydrogenase [Spirochaetota bacterium]
MKASDDALNMLRSNWTEMSGLESDQDRGVPMPAAEKEDNAAAAEGDEGSGARAHAGGSAHARESAGGNVDHGAKRIPLIPPREIHAPGMTVWEALGARASRRKYSDDSVTTEQLSAVLYATQGVRGRRGARILKTAPSGGARHPLELYVVARRVDGVTPGLYHYRSGSHELASLRPFRDDDAATEDGSLDAALRGQLWNAAAYLILTAIPYRTEWRYPGRAGKLVALDAGHALENTYLICEALGLGTCAVGAYDQDLLDAYLGVDGKEELAVYAAPIGVPANAE